MGFYSFRSQNMLGITLYDAMSLSGAAVATDFGDAGFSFMKFLTTFLGISMAGWVDTKVVDQARLPLLLVCCCCPCALYPRVVPFLLFAMAAIVTGASSFDDYQYVHLTIILFGLFVVSLSLVNQYKSNSLKSIRALGGR